MKVTRDLDRFIPDDICKDTNHRLLPAFMFKTSDMTEEDSPIIFTLYKTILNNQNEIALYKVTDKSNRLSLGSETEYYAAHIYSINSGYEVFRLFPLDLSELAELLESYAKEVNYSKVPVLVLNYGEDTDNMYNRIEFKDDFISNVDSTHDYEIYSCFNADSYNNYLSGMPNTYHFDIIWVNDLGSTIM